MNIRALLKELRISLVAILCLGVILCGLYPIVIWGLGQRLFPREANGSLIVKGGKTVGSSLLAQGFAGAKYFHPRPSAAGAGYDAAGSGGSNLGPLSKKLTDDMAQRVRDYRAENNLAPGVPIPADAASASGSGLDPHISPENALLQAPRVAHARGLNEAVVIDKIKAHTEERTLGIFGEPRVNVLLLNLDLDGSP
jgi:K+-transporting ATPase ATPase C chain